MPIRALEELARELEVIEQLGGEFTNDPVKRRILIRSSFAAIESLASAMMVAALPGITQHVLATNQCDSERHTSFFEICALSDLSYQINDHGELVLQSARTRFKNKILFAIRMLAKGNGVELNPKQVEGWDDFQVAISIRNRITHPSNGTDLEVSADDFDTVVKGLQWVIRCNHRACGGQIY